jgi:UDP-sugar pyrophosphorylase
LHASTVDETTVVSTENLALLSTRGQEAILLLQQDEAQRHVVADWPAPGTEDDGKIRLAEQLADLNNSYPGGLTAYLTKAKRLLKESADGTNPFSDYQALVPEGEHLSFDQEGTMDFNEAEQLGLTGIADVALVLVAGGLGERLGYSGIKLSLETNLCTGKSYLAFYIHYLQAMQYVAEIKTGRKNVKIPLAIMTSGDTDGPTRELLSKNHNFGLDDDQITIVMQDKVAALKDGNAGLALDDNDRWSVQTKPHGHGDVHHLLYREGLVSKWQKEGKKYVIFLQDTNALVINSIIPTLGVSMKKGFDMNSICIPRLAGEAAGAITRLEHKTDPDKSLVINVEYNQLDPLLRTQGDCKGDVADPETGYSPFPGNANNIVIEMDAYAKTLRGEDRGVVVEFVNPKYKDDSRTEFKKPTRLECMMQDIPKLFQKEMGKEANIGFTMFDRWFTFSPAKNSLESGIEAVSKGSLAPGTMSSAESDKYIQNQRKLKFAGMDVPVTTEKDLVTIGGIPVTPGPRIILCPAFTISQQEILDKIQGGKITQRSSLVLEGHNLVVKNLDLDGALVIRAGPNSHVTVDGLRVRNDGWELKEIPEDADVPESVRIRGYTMAKNDSTIYIIKEPGNFLIGPDGELKKLD